MFPQKLINTRLNTFTPCLPLFPETDTGGGSGEKDKRTNYLTGRHLNIFTRLIAAAVKSGLQLDDVSEGATFSNSDGSLELNIKRCCYARHHFLGYFEESGIIKPESSPEWKLLLWHKINGKMDYEKAAPRMVFLENEGYYFPCVYEDESLDVYAKTDQCNIYPKLEEISSCTSNTIELCKKCLEMLDQEFVDI